jgi:hypothetical protein
MTGTSPPPPEPQLNRFEEVAKTELQESEALAA